MCVCRDAVCRIRWFLEGNESGFRKNKAGGAAQLPEEVSGCSHLLQCRFAAAFEGGTMAPRSLVPLPSLYSRGPAGALTQCTTLLAPRDFPFDFQFLFSPPLVSALRKKDLQNPFLKAERSLGIKTQVGEQG